ncbi:Uncharacterised protein [uncultured archaeon]|nr:Uncharacterised protein [uncultured archaeon]
MKTRNILIGVAIFAVLFAALVIYIRISLSSMTLPSNQTALGQVQIDAFVQRNVVMSYNNTRDLAVYALTSYSLVNATNLTITLSAYTKSPIRKVYLLNVSGYCSPSTCYDENQLRNSLRNYLQGYDLIKNSSSFNYIPLSQLASVPGDSIIVVPSGILPLPLLNGTGTNIFKLINKGDTIIYAGTNFSRSIRQDGYVSVNSNATNTQLLLYNMTYAPFPGQSRLPQQSTDLSFKYPTFIFSSGSRYGNVTYLNTANGSVVAFPNFPNHYPTSGWNNVDAMASDIAKVINSRMWIPRIATGVGYVNVNSTASGSLGVFANVTRLSKLFSQEAAAVNTSYSLVTILASNPGHSAVAERSFGNKYAWNGIINTPLIVGEGQQALISYEANNMTSPSVQLHIEVYDRNLSSTAQSIRIGTNTVPSRQFGAVTPTFAIPSGYYILALKGFYGYTYAEAYLHIANATINPISTNFKNGSFVFSVSSNGQPVSNATYTINIDGAFENASSVVNGTITYDLPKGTSIQFGTRVFNVRIFNTNYAIRVGNLQTPFNVPPLYIEFAIAIVVVVLLNFILKPPAVDEYYVDVPEFPPSKKEKVPVQEAALLGVFDKINYYYHWRFMPLTVEEIRQGINNNIRINNMPVSVTTQNADVVLSQLKNKGVLAGELNYYAPQAWVNASKHDMEYLVIFRKLRDYCVSHAILFTDLDTDVTADLLMTKEGKQNSVYIYSTEGKMKTLTLSKDSRIFVFFIDELQKEEFLDRLYASFGEDAEVLKLGIEYNYVMLLDCEHIDQLAL